MKTQKNSNWASILIIASFLMVIGCAANEGWSAEVKYPAKPIQLVLGYEPGSTDVGLRPFTDKLQEVLGQPLSFVYKPGAGGAIAAAFVARSKPDGYTFMGTSPGPLILSPLTKEGLGYSLDDFVPICLVARQDTLLTVKGDSRWKNIQEIIQEAKKSPGKITYATSGVLGTTHIPMALLEKYSGAQMTHIPTTGGGPAVTAVLGGHVDLGVAPTAAVSSHIKSGMLRAVAVVGKERRKDLPGVPTLTELGYPITFTGWYAVVGPKGMPADIYSTIIKAADRVKELHRKAIEDQFEALEMTSELVTGAAFGQFLKEQNDLTKTVVEDVKKSMK